MYIKIYLESEGNEIKKSEEKLIKVLLMIPLIILFDAIFKIDFKVSYFTFLIISLIIIINNKKKNVIMLISIYILLFIQIFFYNKSLDLNELMLFNDFILITVYSCTYKSINNIYNILFKYRKVVLLVIIFISIIFLISFFSPWGWMYVWEGNQFKGVISFPHDACYFFCGIQIYSILTYYMFENKKIKAISISINSIFCMFSLFTNARTPFLMSLYIFIYFIFKISKKRVIIRYFIITIPIMIFLIALSLNIINIEFLAKIPILNKFFVTMERGDLTSSRDLIWQNLINIYQYTFSFSDKILGKGTGFSQNANMMLMGKKLWAHNDFIEIIVSIGYYGLFLYLDALLLMLIKTKKILLLMIFIIVAFSNGVFVYRQIILFIPVLICVFTNIYEMDRKRAVK